MIIRRPKTSDNEQIFKCFTKAQITRAEAISGNPKTGFLDYPLSFPELSERVIDEFSLVLEEKGRVIGYVIAYRIGDISLLNSGKTDTIHQRIRKLPANIVYVDQLYLNPRLPVFVLGRSTDTWEHSLRSSNIPAVITAIPQNPWQNRSSTRFVLARGFSKESSVEADEIRFDLFAKRYLSPNKNYQHYGSLRF